MAATMSSTENAAKLAVVDEEIRATERLLDELRAKRQRILAAERGEGHNPLGDDSIFSYGIGDPGAEHRIQKDLLG